MDINAIIIAAVTGIITGAFTLGVTLVTTRIRARAEARQRIWTQIEWALGQALSGKTPEARQAGRRAARAMALKSDDELAEAFVSAALGDEESSLILK